jgi:hypothetical protein
MGGSIVSHRTTSNEHSELNGSQGSTGDLLKQLAEQTSDLLRKEVDLAKAELAEKSRQAGKGAGLFGGAGALGFFGFAALTVAIILGLGTLIPVWVAALVVAIAYGAGAAAIAIRGREEMQQATPPVPEQTIETIEEDVQWARSQRQSVQR